MAIVIYSRVGTKSRAVLDFQFLGETRGGGAVSQHSLVLSGDPPRVSFFCMFDLLGGSRRRLGLGNSRSLGWKDSKVAVELKPSLMGGIVFSALAWIMPRVFRLILGRHNLRRWRWLLLVGFLRLFRRRDYRSSGSTSRSCKSK
ncbi:unnamed protein product [Ilex paraguariensis]|uniref:Uncharacterized protein n=1 Tax=Ilex paraguariensis TaxID=185542 RepID=A0ABC8RPV2_9AQUA